MIVPGTGHCATSKFDEAAERIELPIKRLLTGADCDSVIDRASLATPEALADFERYAAALATHEEMGTPMTENLLDIQAVEAGR